MKKIYLTLAITTALCDISAYACEPYSPDIGSAAPLDNGLVLTKTAKFTVCRAPAPIDVRPAARVLTRHEAVLEEVLAIVNGRLTYNQSLLDVMCKADESITLHDHLAYYSHVSGIDFTLCLTYRGSILIAEERYEMLVSGIKADLEKYTFYRDSLQTISKNQDLGEQKKLMDEFYALIRCNYKIESDTRAVNAKSVSRARGGDGKKGDFDEISFLLEMSKLLEGLEISPAYRRCPDYLTIGNLLEDGGNETCFGTKHLEVNVKFLENICILKEKMDSEKMDSTASLLSQSGKGKVKKAYEPLLERLLKSKNRVDELGEEYKTLVGSIRDKLSGLAPDFQVLTEVCAFLRVAPEAIHDLELKMISINPELQAMTAELDRISADFKAAKAWEVTQTKMLTAWGGGRNAGEKKYRISSYSPAAQEEFHKRQAEAEEISRNQKRPSQAGSKTVKTTQGGGAPTAFSVAVLKISGTSSGLPGDATDIFACAATGASTGAQVVEVVSVHKAEKVKTKGISTAVLAEAAPIEVARVITQEVRDFVTCVMDETDFDSVKQIFSRARGLLGSPADHSVSSSRTNKWVFKFRSPVTDTLQLFYADNPHGAQLEKFRSHWRANMEAALERGEMIAR